METKQELKGKESNIMRIHISLINRINDFIERFEKKHGVSLTSTQATKIIDDKIEKIGGILV
ncbi:hypothetical protein GF386_04060 [Candidatus Pacearchaeota archaeon]|nr:hypothetical protein [Candidatus Pacearchaeota archaeon]